jgi:hypothetical protein
VEEGLHKLGEDTEKMREDVSSQLTDLIAEYEKRFALIKKKLRI